MLPHSCFRLLHLPPRKVQGSKQICLPSPKTALSPEGALTCNGAFRSPSPPGRLAANKWVRCLTAFLYLGEWVSLAILRNLGFKNRVWVFLPLPLPTPRKARKSCHVACLGDRTRHVTCMRQSRKTPALAGSMPCLPVTHSPPGPVALL